MTTNVCPQCECPIPREGSRFCNQCGADLRTLVPASTSAALPTVSTISESATLVDVSNAELPDAVALPVSAPLKTAQTNITMTVSQDETKSANNQPEATLHILLRDGNVIERDLTSVETKFGKNPNNEIILPDASVSGTHALIKFENGVYVLNDLGSRNGTFLNDVRVAEPRPLQHGDLIKMGHCTLTFRLKEAENTISMPRTVLLGDLQPPPPPPAPPAPKAPAMTEDSLAQALASSGLVAQAEIDRLRGTGAKGRRLYRALLEDKLVTEIGLRDLMSRTFNLVPVELKTMEIDAQTALRLRPEFLRERLICPVVSQQPDRLMLAVADPTDKATLDEIERLTRKPASLRLAMPSEIAAYVAGFFTPRLIGVLPSGEKIETLLNQPELEIGKAPHNKLVISDPTVSSTHAIVLTRDGGYSVVDLGSSNGTFVNGKQLGSEAHTLQHGDKIQLGQVLLTFRNPAETTENKTARLSLDALEEIRRRAAGRPEAAGPRTDPSAWQIQTPAAAPVAAATDDSEKKKKKNKEKDKNSWLSANSLSRILAQVLGALISLGGAVYLIRSSSQTDKPSSGGGGNSGVSQSHQLTSPGAWEDFSTGLFGGTIEASGVSFAPGLNGVLFVSDNRAGEVLWMQLDETGKQTGSIKKIPLGVNFKDPEAITYGNSYFYLLTSQSDPQDGEQHIIVRFDFTPETQTLRGQPEVITGLRNFLLQNVSELSSLGAPAGMQGGLNIEGIAWDPNNERLLLGLRSPLIGTQAVLVPLKLRDPRGPFTLENLKVDDPHVIVLSLETHGVRDITYDARLKNFLIISGAPETAPKTDFGLWEWSGQPDAKPIKVMTLDDKMKPEGITSASIGGRNFIFLVGDSGGYLKIDYAGAH